MITTTINKFVAMIYLGFREHYSDVVHSTEELKSLLQKYVDERGLCVTIMPCDFVYTKGSEPGAAIGLINYPRFPATEDEIKTKTKDLAIELMLAFRQFRVSIVFSDEIILLDDEIKEN